MLQPSTHPGECWCFHGSEGQAIVQLAVPVHVTGVSLEHIPKSLSHTGRIDSAPRDFLIKALESDSAQDGEILGSFIYNKDGKPIQYFPVMVRISLFYICSLQKLRSYVGRITVWGVRIAFFASSVSIPISDQHDILLDIF